MEDRRRGQDIKIDINAVCSSLLIYLFDSCKTARGSGLVWSGHGLAAAKISLFKPNSVGWGGRGRSIGAEWKTGRGEERMKEKKGEWENGRMGES